ncbi:MAG: multidrug efflux SMR transporter [Firmicutes bacterium]|nr:multidrug efflux SMR transporter [Bacillota bacterium]
MLSYILLAIAIVFEVLATSMLPATRGFTVRKPTILVIIFYVICFAAFGRSLLMLNLGIAWATWGAVGTIVTPIVGIAFYHQKITKTGIVGLVLIIISTITLNLFG